MVSFVRFTLATSTLVLRLLSYIFLRWIPGHPFPPSIITLLVLYLTTIAIAEPSDDNGSSSRRRSTIGGKPGETNHGSTKESLTQSEKSTAGRLRASLVTLLSGIPNRSTRLCTAATVSFNVILSLLVTDFVLRPPLLYPLEDLRFSRVGFIGTDTAKILVREPDLGQLPLSLSYKQAGVAGWTEVGRLYKLSNETDYTYPFTINGLLSSTAYSYAFSNNLTGEFTTAPTSSDSLTFLTSSCIKARFPYNILVKPLAIRGLDYLPSILEHFPSPNKFMLFLGDFIYVDVPWRVSSSPSHYRSEYRRVYASPSWSISSSVKNLPWLHTWDDHEIANDWSSGEKDPYRAAVDPFQIYHASVNPPAPKLAQANQTTYSSWDQGPASFFVLDTRSYRTDPEPNPEATILGSKQLVALLDFISMPVKPGLKWKIIASSVPFTKNWRIGTKDTWGGFLGERERVLAAMHTAEAELGVRIIVLSGDRHEFGAIRFPVSKDAGSLSDSGVHEFSVGPLSMFYLPVPSFRQVDEQDVTIQYLPNGNSKVGVIDIRREQLPGGYSYSVLDYALFVDGRQAWNYTLRVPI